MKIKFLLLPILMHSANVLSQNTVITTGGNASSISGSVSYSVGQIDYASASVSNKGTVSLGIQQPLIISALTSTKGAEKLTITCSIFPNPSSDFIILSWESGFDASFVNYKIADMNGKNLVSALTQNQSKIAVNDFAVGTYTITVSDIRNNFIKSFKLIKN